MKNIVDGDRKKCNGKNSWGYASTQTSFHEITWGERKGNTGTCDPRDGNCKCHNPIYAEGMGETVETCNEFQQVELSISIASAFTVAGTVWLVMMVSFAPVRRRPAHALSPPPPTKAARFTCACVLCVAQMTKHGLGKYATKLAERVERRLRRDRIQALIDKALEEVPIVPKRIKRKPTKYKRLAKLAFAFTIFLSVLPFLMLELVRMLFDAFLLMNNWKEIAIAIDPKFMTSIDFPVKNFLKHISIPLPGFDVMFMQDLWKWAVEFLVKFTDWAGALMAATKVTCDGSTQPVFFAGHIGLVRAV